MKIDFIHSIVPQIDTHVKSKALNERYEDFINLCKNQQHPSKTQLSLDYHMILKRRMLFFSFKNEDEERNFWSKTDLSDYFQPSDFETAVFPNLKPTSQAK